MSIVELWADLIYVTFMGALISAVILCLGEMFDLVILKVVGITIIALVVIAWILCVGALLVR